jgi:Flp pilus assembly pilin Flp
VRRIGDLAHDRKGATVIEYGLIVGLIFCVIAGSVHLFASKVVGTLNYVSNEVVNAGDS